MKRFSGETSDNSIESNTVSEQEDPYSNYFDNREHDNNFANKVEHNIEGIVKNFFEQEIPTFFVTKVFRSLFQGLPFVVSNTVNTFQVYEGWGLNSGDNQIGTEVIIYGKIARGKLPENNVVKVLGKKNKHGSIVAKKIYNNTSQTYVKINHSVSPIIVWILLSIVIYIIYMLTQINWGQVFAEIFGFLFMIIICLVLFFFIIVAPFRRIFGKKD